MVGESEAVAHRENEEPRDIDARETISDLGDPRDHERGRGKEPSGEGGSAQQRLIFLLRVWAGPSPATRALTTI